ncbi:hypothetical protein Rsub_03959 [Raphidocelis subcapitata]|uniref:Protein phosphatase n=1 Tax=Raphidocelis subcapitata TaxID=307507 RepID=A0A2V0P3J9_9CHLO|nr:hypothetical protein Rsub_03959 [Raphidocelis subcapitata]|eukprot:GBF91655.1 hypothetical protein Rsub_03959 [Raphidocelis subcapitata]
MRGVASSWALWRMSLSRGLGSGVGKPAAAAGPFARPLLAGGPHRSGCHAAPGTVAAAASIHSLALGALPPARHALAPPGGGVAAAARELQRFARGGGAALGVPLLRRKMHAVAHSLAPEQAAAAAAAAGSPFERSATAGPDSGDGAGRAASSSGGRDSVEPAAPGSATEAAADCAGGMESSTSTSSSDQSSGGNGFAGSGSGGGAAAAAGPAASSSSTDSSSSGGGAAGASAGASGDDAPPSGPARGPAPVLLHSGASMLPHPDKAHRGGEDAFFISDPPHAIGVADGVGGWAEIGVDAGAYARLLMSNAKEEAEAAMSAAAPGAPLSPQAVLERAYYRTNVQGSSTVCILALNGSTLCASNVGDSGFVLVRDGAPAFQSPQQQHNFNFPYQLGSADGGASDHPQSAMRFELAVRPGDVIITGTDGLWDNVFADEAAAIAARCKAQGDGPEAVAHTLCRYARMRATDPKYHSPFSYQAVAAGFLFTGGKLDDICVVVSYIALGGSKL